MALCRWSTPGCDLYIYETATGIMCHVAARNDDLEPIGLSHDGQSFTAGDWRDLLSIVTMLAAAGYRVPAWVLNEVREEAAEEGV